MLGGAKEALDLVSRAAGATRVRLASGQDDTTWRTSSDEESEGLEYSPPSTPEVREERSAKPAPSVRRASCSPSPFRETFATASREVPPQPSNAPPSPEPEHGWSSDEAPPFDVPPSTPFPSRPASPKPNSSPPRSPHIGAEQRLPPRPPLKVLVPSLLFALVWTAVKLLSNWWTGKVSPRRAGAGRKSRQ